MRSTVFTILAVLAFPALAQEAGQRRALIISANRGLQNEEALRFADADARRVAETLLEVGGFDASVIDVVQGATAESVRAALTDLSLRLAGVERLYVYVSSHAGSGTLHLSGTELPMSELVEFLRRAPVKVGVLVVDACQSGRVTQTKGLTPVSGTAPRLEATSVEGRVLISASGADEYAQESDALGGSYFTHYLLTALRGAGDANHDGKVTLDESYAWAWSRTIEATFSTRSGVQRPMYSVDLRGSGQLVLSEPTRSSSQLVLDVKPAGHWLIVSEASGALVADVEKGEGALALAVQPGGYRVQLRARDSVLERRIEVPAAGAARVSGDDLERASLLRVARKGGEEVQLHVSAGGGASSSLVKGLDVQPTLELRFHREAFLVSVLNQLIVDFALRQGAAAQTGFQQLEFELRVGTGHRFAWDGASVSIGLEAGPLFIHQSSLPDGSSRNSLGLVADLGLEGRVRVAGPVDVILRGSGGGALVRKLSGVTLVPRVSAILALGFNF